MAITSSGPQSPIMKLVIAVGLLMLVAAGTVAGLGETRLTCTRAECVTVHTFPSSRTRQDLTDIRAVEVHRGSGKQRDTHNVYLVNTRGSSIRIHSSGEAGAAQFKRELEEVLTGQRPQLEVVSPPMYWMLAFVALLVLLAIYEIRDTIRNWGKYVRPPRQPTNSRPYILWGALVVGALVVSAAGNFILERSQADSTGLLQLECRHRCEFGNGTCLPGGAMEMRLNSGEYEVKVWNPDAPNSWELHKIHIEVGQETRFVCEPRR